MCPQIFRKIVKISRKIAERKNKKITRFFIVNHFHNSNMASDNNDLVDDWTVYSEDEYGEDGEAGEAREDGDDGEAGEDGDDGDDGDDRKAGEDGEDGEAGDAGEAGEAGEDGKDGEDRDDGEAGEDEMGRGKRDRAIKEPETLERKKPTKRQKVTLETKLVKKMETIFSEQSKVIPRPTLVDSKCFQGEHFEFYKGIHIKEVNKILEPFSKRLWPKDVHVLCGNENDKDIQLRTEDDFSGLPWIENECKIPSSLAKAKDWFYTLIFAREEDAGVALVRQLRVKREFQELEIVRRKKRR